jgi:hypothetical protein
LANIENFLRGERKKMRSKNVTIWATILVSCLGSQKTMAWIQFDDGGTYNIDYEIRDEVWVDYQAPGMETTVNWLEGARIPSTARLLGTEVHPTGYKLKGFEDSRINVSGGSTWDLYSHDRSQVTISSGSVETLFAFDSSQVTVSGGETGGPLYAYDNSQVTIFEGKIGYTLHAYDSSRVSWSGGSVGDSWYTVSPTGKWDGHTEDNMYVDDEAILTIEGLGFAIDGTPTAYGDITSVLAGPLDDEPVRHLTGTLANGQSIHNDFYIGHEAKIVLVPEPATVLLLGLGGLAFLRRRKR